MTGGGGNDGRNPPYDAVVWILPPDGGGRGGPKTAMLQFARLPQIIGFGLAQAILAD